MLAALPIYRGLGSKLGVVPLIEDAAVLDHSTLQNAAEAIACLLEDALRGFVVAEDTREDAYQ